MAQINVKCRNCSGKGIDPVFGGQCTSCSGSGQITFGQATAESIRNVGPDGQAMKLNSNKPAPTRSVPEHKLKVETEQAARASQERVGAAVTFGRALLGGLGGGYKNKRRPAR